MSIRKILSANNLAEITRKVVAPDAICIGRNGVFVTVPLREWNRYGLDCIV